MSMKITEKATSGLEMRDVTMLSHPAKLLPQQRTQKQKAEPIVVEAKGCINVDLLTKRLDK